MTRRLRVLAAAAVAFLVGGGLIVHVSTVPPDLRSLFLAYVWFFLFLEFWAFRGACDEDAFYWGAAFGLVYHGVYTKALQEAVFFLGVDWPAAAALGFDWGMTTVVSLHVVDALIPRSEEPSKPGLLEWILLLYLPAAAMIGYLSDTIFDRYRFTRMIGSTWLLADLLFAVLAWLLIRRAAVRRETSDAQGCESWLFCLAGFCIWQSGAPAAIGIGTGWPGFAAVALLFVWMGAVAWGMRRLWLAGQRRAAPPRRAASAVLALAAWRGLVALFALGALEGSARIPLFSLLADLPSRVIFSLIFLTSRLRV